MGAPIYYTAKGSGSYAAPVKACFSAGRSLHSRYLISLLPSTIIEYYYKARWGFADEFIRLFKKNHYPVLKKQMEMGRILQVNAVTPRFHSTEDGRWDYRVTIVFRDIQTAFGEFDSEPINKELYPDQETFKREEQRRFEILQAHWDLPINSVDLEKK